MLKRIIVGVIAAAVLILFIWLHGWYIAGAAVIVALLVQYEIMKAISGTGVKLIKPVLYAFTLLLLPTYILYDLPGIFFLQTITVCVIFVAGIVFKSFNFESIFSSVFTVYYPGLFFVFLYMIIRVPDAELSRLMLLVGFGAAVLTDTFAYFVGSFCGKTPLCPAISPKKTVEGALGGLMGGIIGVEVMAILFDNGRVRLIEYALLALLLSVMAQVGDLAASIVKRRYGIKDFGTILPGHGGMFDRMDSTLFVLPFVYMFYKLYLGF